MAQWWNSGLEHARPWVLSLVPEKKKKMLENEEGIRLSALRLTATHLPE